MVVHSERQRESADLIKVRLESGLSREGPDGVEVPGSRGELGRDEDRRVMCV